MYIYFLFFIFPLNVRSNIKKTIEDGKIVVNAKKMYNYIYIYVFYL